MTLLTGQIIDGTEVDIGTKRGGDTPGYSSRWKTYYVLRAQPTLGVLLAHEADQPRQALADQLAKLDEEATNYERLRTAGYDVPMVRSASISVVDNLAGGVRAAALVVEHIPGRGPFKARTETTTIGNQARTRETRLHLLYTKAWARLSTAAAEIAPMDLQVILADDGRIVTIDPEKIGSGFKLQPLY